MGEGLSRGSGPLAGSTPGFHAVPPLPSHLWPQEHLEACPWALVLGGRGRGPGRGSGLSSPEPHCGRRGGIPHSSGEVKAAQSCLTL